MKLLLEKEEAARLAREAAALLQATGGADVTGIKQDQAAATATKKAAAAASAKTITDPSTGKKVKLPLQPPLPPIFTAHYVLDFGYVVKGSSKTRKFRMTNSSSQQVTFRFDKALLESWGFKVDPEVRVGRNRCCRH